METSSKSKRKLLPFVFDISYHIQIIFIFTFGYIWISAFFDDYEAPYPEDPIAIAAIDRANWWRGIYSCVLFLSAYAYLEPYNLDFFAPLQRFWRITDAITVAYLLFIIIMMHHRPSYGRK